MSDVESVSKVRYILSYITMWEGGHSLQKIVGIYKNLWGDISMGINVLMLEYMG